MPALAQGYTNAGMEPLPRPPSCRWRTAIRRSSSNNPQVLQFAQDTARYFQHMPLMRVNIYNAQRPAC